MRTIHLRSIALLGLLIATQGPVLAMKMAVQVDDQELWHLGEQIEFLEDPNGEFDAAFAAAQGGWQSSQNGSPNFGFTSSAYWFRVHLQNAHPRARSLYLEIIYPLLDDVRLYRYIDDRWSEELRMGDMLPFGARPIDHRQLLAPITMQSAVAETLLLRVETTSSMQLSLTLWQPSAFHRHDLVLNLFYGGFFGLMGVMLLYNLVIYLSLRDRSYLYFICLVVCTAAAVALLGGFAYQFMWPESPFFNQRALTSVILIGCGTWLLFADSFFELDSQMPGFGHWFRIAALASVTLVLTTVLLPHRIGISVSTLWIVPTCLAVAYISLVLWRRGHPTAGYYTLAWGAFIVGAIVIALNKLGLIPRTFLTEHTAAIASAFEMVVLSLALAYRLSLIGRVERDNLRDLANAKAERMASQTVLVTGIAHALNTPLGTGISAVSHLKNKHDRFTHALDGESGTPSGENLDDYLRMVGQSSRLASDNLERCAELVRSFKAIAIDPTEAMCAYSVDEHIQRAIAELRYEIDRSGHSLDFECNVKEMAFGYPTAVRRVLMALINNALEHAFPAREEGRIHVSADCSNDRLILRVNDNGVGIDQQHVNRVFDPFFTTQRGLGRKIGLGMHLVKSIVTQQLNGKVEVETSADGTRVAMGFPLKLDPGFDTFLSHDNPEPME
jgi:signal transduction histidine kinase